MGPAESQLLFQWDLLGRWCRCGRIGIGRWYRDWDGWCTRRFKHNRFGDERFRIGDQYDIHWTNDESESYARTWTAKSDVLSMTTLTCCDQLSFGSSSANRWFQADDFEIVSILFWLVLKSLWTLRWARTYSFHKHCSILHCSCTSLLQRFSVSPFRSCGLLQTIYLHLTQMCQLCHFMYTSNTRYVHVLGLFVSRRPWLRPKSQPFTVKSGRSDNSRESKKIWGPWRLKFRVWFAETLMINFFFGWEWSQDWPRITSWRWCGLRIMILFWNQKMSENHLVANGYLKRESNYCDWAVKVLECIKCNYNSRLGHMGDKDVTRVTRADLELPSLPGYPTTTCRLSRRL